MVFSTVAVTPTEVLYRFAKSFGAIVANLAVIVIGAFFLRAFFYQNNKIESFDYELSWDEGVIIGVPVGRIFLLKREVAI